jgi:Holliday junction resolvase RusA-like endonuclease
LKDITLKLTGQIIPKARPRLGSNGAYSPENYRNWKDWAIIELCQQYRQKKRIELVDHIGIILHGKHSRRGDSDNIAGSILDALVQAEILKGDNLIVVPSLSIQLFYSAEEPEAVVTIVLPKLVSNAPKSKLRGAA